MGIIIYLKNKKVIFYFPYLTFFDIEINAFVKISSDQCIFKLTAKVFFSWKIKWPHLIMFHVENENSWFTRFDGGADLWRFIVSISFRNYWVAIGQWYCLKCLIEWTQWIKIDYMITTTSEIISPLIRIRMTRIYYIRSWFYQTSTFWQAKFLLLSSTVPFLEN